MHRSFLHRAFSSNPTMLWEDLLVYSFMYPDIIFSLSAGNEAIWFRQLLDDMGFPQKTVTIYEDNQACISLTKNPEDHKRTKHIQVRFHVIRDYVAKELIKFVYCSTKDQLADVFTKGVSGCQLRDMMKNFGVSHFKSQGES